MLDSARVRVERIVLEPGQFTLWHEHRAPGLDVGISPGTISALNANGGEERATYASGSYHWYGDPGVHALTNVGRVRLEIVEIELK